MTSKITVIDGDSICYICSKEDALSSIDTASSMVKNILEETKASKYFVFLSKSPYFRHSVNRDYKGNRKPDTTLHYKRTVRNYLIDQWGAKAFKDVEADDMVTYASNNFNDITISSGDKDVLKQVSGKHYDYFKREWVDTTAEEADQFLLLQTLMGDSTDNIRGIPGIGIKKANDILEEDSSINKVFSSYLLKWLNDLPSGIYEFQKNFRQVYILRTDGDFMREVGYIPEVEFLEYKKEEEDW